MAQTDWTELSDGADATSQINRGVTGGITAPTGGGSFVFGFKSVDSSTLSAGYRYSGKAEFSPMSKGGTIRGALSRGASGAATGFSHFLYIGLANVSLISPSAQAYMIGLEDADPARIVLRKGLLQDGIPVGTAANSLRRSQATFTKGDFVHVRLDMVVNGNGDVVLNCFRNTSGDVSSPTWSAEAGLEQYVDDSLGVASGSTPFTSGYAGFGMRSEVISAQAFLDHLEIQRQL